MDRPKARERQSRSGVAGDDDNVGLDLGRDARDRGLDPGDQLRLAQASIGKGCVVGDIDDLDVRTKAPDLGKNGEPAKARIEDERARAPAVVRKGPFGQISDPSLATCLAQYAPSPRSRQS